MSPQLLLEATRSAKWSLANWSIDLRGHATDTRAAVYAARKALIELEDVLAARTGETLVRGHA